MHKIKVGLLFLFSFIFLQPLHNLKADVLPPGKWDNSYDESPLNPANSLPAKYDHQSVSIISRLMEWQNLVIALAVISMIITVSLILIKLKKNKK